MHEGLSQNETYQKNPEKIQPPKDSFEVLENTFAIASPGERSFLHTEELYDCKAVALRNSETGKTLLAHLSCTTDLDKAVGTWVDLITSDDSASIDVSISTGSNYTSEYDLDTPAYDEPELVYPSLKTLTACLATALGDRSDPSAFEIDTTKSDIPRGIAIDLSTGKRYEIDVMAGDGEAADTSRNRVIESSLE